MGQSTAAPLVQKALSFQADLFCHLLGVMFSTPLYVLYFREALLAEMGVAMREDGGTVGVFSPKKV